MSDTIESLYYGNLEPTKMTGKFAPRLKNQLKRLTEIEESLCSKLIDAILSLHIFCLS